MGMMAHAEPMEPGLGSPLLKSVVFHAAMVGLVVGWAWWLDTRVESFGDDSAVGGVTVVATDGIPVMQRRGPENPVANDTDSQVPEERRKTREREDDPDAVALDRMPKKKKPKLTEFEKRILENQKKIAEQDLKPAQVYSTTGAAAVSPLFSQSTSGAGGMVGTGNPFGHRFGFYAQLITQRISQKWRTQDVDPRVQSANICSVGFEIRRDGSTRDVKVIQSSGNYEVDRSAERAVTEASPFPPLPDGFERNSARVQINFQFKR